MPTEMKRPELNVVLYTPLDRPPCGHVLLGVIMTGLDWSQELAQVRVEAGDFRVELNEQLVRNRHVAMAIGPELLAVVLSGVTAEQLAAVVGPERILAAAKHVRGER